MSTLDSLKVLQQRYRTWRLVESHLETTPFAQISAFYGFLPQVYLIGEDHTDHDHIQFTLDLTEAIRPNAIFFEGAGDIIRPSDIIYENSLEGELRRRGFSPDEFFGKLANLEPWQMSEVGLACINDEECREEMRAKVAEEAALVREYQQNPEGILTAPYYRLPGRVCGHILDAVTAVMAEAAKEVSEELLLRICEAAQQGAPEKAKRLKTIYTFLNGGVKHVEFVEAVQEEGYDLGDLEPIVALHFHLYRSYFVAFRINRIDDELCERIGRHRLVHEFIDTVPRQGVEIHPFDDNHLKSLLDDKGLSSADRFHINLGREARMAELLLEYLSTESGIVFTYGGRKHVRNDSPILERLRAKKVSHSVLHLISNGTPEELARRQEDYSTYLYIQSKFG